MPTGPGPDAQPMHGFWYGDPATSPDWRRDGPRLARHTAAPPWLVVDHTLDSVIVGSRWPAELWRVRVLELGDMSGLVAQPGYWRATAIELIERLPLAALFGAHGDAVVGVIDRVRELSIAQARALAASSDDAAHGDAAEAAYARAWAHWVAATADPARAAAGPEHAEAAYRGVIAAPSRHRRRSAPVGVGFSVIHDQLRARARALEGDAAFVVETDPDDGETETCLAPVWRAALEAALHAAMAIGAPEHVATGDDRARLLRTWDAVLGHTP